MQSYSNNDSIEEQSLHSMNLQPHIQSLPQQPQHQHIPSHHNNPINPPSSRNSISSNQQSLEASQQQPQLQSLANLPSQQHQKKKSLQQQSQQLQKKSQISNFIIKTYRILQDPINSNIIHWTDQGNAFIVKNKDKFQNQILPKYFKHKKFSSFVRQLNMYDFHKIRKEKEIPIFKHKYFREGCVDLLCKIKRKSGEEGIAGGDDQQVGQVNIQAGTRNYIPSLADLAQKPMISAYSFKSKSNLPYPSMITSQPSIGQLPGSGAHASQLDLLLQQNNELNTSISQLTRQQSSLQLLRERKRQKIMKILSVLTNFNLGDPLDNQMSFLKENQQFSYSQNGEIVNLRDLQNHFSSEEEPFSFVQYTHCLRNIYTNVKSNLMKMNTLVSEESQQHKIDQQKQ